MWVDVGAPASVTVITAEDIERYGYQTLAEAIGSVRGFYTSYDRNYAYLGARGFSRPSDYNNRILLLVNGLTTNEAQYGSAAVGTDLGIDLSLIEKIEVIRGPGSALYGSSAMLAVVNIITRGARTLSTVQAVAKAGSYGRKGGSVLVGEVLDNGLEVVLSGLWEDATGQDLYFEEFDDPSTNQGVSEQMDWDRVYGFMGTVAFKGLTVQAKYSDRNKGIPTGPWETVFNSGDTWSVDRLGFLEMKYEQALAADKQVMLRGHVSHYGYRGAYPYEYEGEIIGVFDKTVEYWGGGELRFRWDTGSDNRLVVGTEFVRHFRSDYRYWDEYEVYSEFKAPLSHVSIYAQDDFQVTPRLALVLGLRHDQYSTVGGSTTPRAALIYTPFSSSTVKLLYGTAFRAPGGFELNFEDPLFDQKKNPNLKPEHIRTLEAVWEQMLGHHFSAAVSVYDYHMRNLIDQGIDPEDEMLTYLNIGEVNAQGIEVEFNARFESGLSGYASYTYQEAYDAEIQLSNSPHHIAKAGVTAPFFERFFAAAQMRYESERLTIYETNTDAYFLADLTLSAKRLFGRVSPSIQIRNVFDAHYMLPGGYEHVQPAIEQDGRTVVFKAAFTF
ncbi:MAG: TonB-dependent receptor [Bacteroidetes bacterium]|nr:TonB-dependent receptor [Bacteroidota bacterium]